MSILSRNLRQAAGVCALFPEESIQFEREQMKNPLSALFSSGKEGKESYVVGK